MTAGTATAAREQALVQGQRKAFERLLRRLTLREDHDRLPSLENKTVAEFVQGFEVEQEKASSVRYLARLTFHFKPEDIRALLRRGEIPFAETASKPVLVLPVYRAAGATLLWDDPNPWHTAWAERPETDGLVPLIVPVGDLADIADIGAEQALRGDRNRLRAIARRYEAGDVIVSLASLGFDLTTNQPTVHLAVSRYGTAVQEQTIVDAMTARPGESVEAMLKRAATEIAVQIEDNWKRENLLRFDRQDSLTVSVPLERLEDWLKVRERLGNIPFIRQSELIYLSRTEAKVRLRYIGDTSQLRLALAQSDLSLSQGPTSWVLRSSGGGAKDAADSSTAAQ